MFGFTVTLMNWEPYDPTWLVEPAREQVPEEPWLPELALVVGARMAKKRSVHLLCESQQSKQGWL